MTTSVFIYCNDPSHDRSRAVTDFYQIKPVGIDDPEAGRWNERYTSTAAQGRRESGTTLIGDRLPQRGEIQNVVLGGGTAEAEIRSRYRLECRKCRRRPVVATEEKLFAVLNKLAAEGITRISLQGLRLLFSDLAQAARPPRQQ